MKNRQMMRKDEIIEPVIDDSTIFFGVSRLAAKMRMVDVGYEEAIGAEDPAIQSVTNPALRKLVETGQYQYVDWMFL